MRAVPAGSAVRVLRAGEETPPPNSRLYTGEARLDWDRQHGSSQIWQEKDRKGNVLGLGP